MMPPKEYIGIHAEHIEAVARRIGVKSAIHPDDHIFSFLTAHPSYPGEKAATYYFEDGANSKLKIERLTKELFLTDRHSLLEFASGYGCVTRHLINSSRYDLHACDIHPAAVDFLERDLGARAFLSAPFPEMLKVPQQFDAVFALSFFSHMPITTWTRWLVRLVRAARPGGFVIFTTHGLKTPLSPNLVIPPTGFWFTPASEQADLPTEQYGTTITTPAFVHTAIASIHGIKLIKFEEAAWWGHQDLYVIQVDQPMRKQLNFQSYREAVKAIGYIVLPYNKRRREKRRKLLAGLR
jgi:SAM-dependent methyltransferase